MQKVDVSNTKITTGISIIQNEILSLLTYITFYLFFIYLITLQRSIIGSKTNGCRICHHTAYNSSILTLIYIKIQI